MPHSVLPTPKRGDVLFFRAVSCEDFISSFVQWRIDPYARQTDQKFSHAALAIDDLLALDAVPPSSKKQPSTWTGLEQTHGVRLVPLPDLYIDDNRPAEFVVLRYPSASAGAEPGLVFDLVSKARAWGKAYSVVALRESFEEYLQDKLPDWVSKRLAIRFPARFDYASDAPFSFDRLDFDEDTRRLLEEWAPQANSQMEARRYYCSEFVAEMLKSVGLIEDRTSTAVLTPAGLFALLLKLGWRDVTLTDYASDAVEHLISRDDLKSVYKSAQAFATEQYILTQGTLAIKSEAELLAEVLGNLNKRLR